MGKQNNKINCEPCEYASLENYEPTKQCPISYKPEFSRVYPCEICGGTFQEITSENQRICLWQKKRGCELYAQDSLDNHTYKVHGIQTENEILNKADFVSSRRAKSMPNQIPINSRN